MSLLIFATCLLVNFANGVDNSKEDILLPCYFGSYDANSDGVIDVDEFLDITHGYTKVRPDVIFDRMDMNHDNRIVYSEFRLSVPGLHKDHVFDHCKRRGCWWCSHCCTGRRR